MASSSARFAVVATLLALQLLLWAKQTSAVTVYACESEMLSVFCNAPGEVVIVRSAMYGRHAGNFHKCGDNLNLTTPCEVDVADFFRYKCEGKADCHVHVDLATFNAEFCPDVFKYAEVEYDCVAAPTHVSYRRCSEKCLPFPPASASQYKQTAPSLTAAAAKPFLPPASVAIQSAAPNSNTAVARSPASSGSSAPKRLFVGPTAPVASSLPYSSLNQNLFDALRNSGNAHAQSATGTGNSNNAAMVNQLRQALISRMQSMLSSLQNKRTVG